MFAVETNAPSPEVNGSRPALGIRFQFVDGSEETFIQPDTERAEDLANLISYSVYPGVTEIPADTWMAQSKS